MLNESENARYYAILGVSEDASLEDMKTAYKKAAMKHHPDKGGDPEKFKELVQAYDVLSGLVAQKIGMDGLGSGRAQQLRKGEDAVHQLKVSLKELYGGTFKKLYLWRKVICSNCTGKGTGETICAQCKGDKVVKKKKVLEVKVEKGMQNGQKITFPGLADEAPDAVPGDLVVLIQQEEHPIFKRTGDDLSIEHTVSLNEALCGFRHELSHLDGRPIHFESDPAEVLNDSYKVIDNEGMPLYQRPSMKGKLIIHFKVLSSDYMDIDKANTPEAILSPEAPSAMELD